MSVGSAPCTGEANSWWGLAVAASLEVSAVILSPSQAVGLLLLGSVSLLSVSPRGTPYRVHSLLGPLSSAHTHSALTGWPIAPV